MAEDLEPVVDEVGEAERLADAGLLVAFAAEMHAAAVDARVVVKTVVIEPVERALLHARAAFRDQEDAIAEALGHEPAQGVEGAGYRRRPQVVVGEKGGIGVPVRAGDDDAADIHSERSRCRVQGLSFSDLHGPICRPQRAQPSSGGEWPRGRARISGIDAPAA